MIFIITLKLIVLKTRKPGHSQLVGGCLAERRIGHLSLVRCGRPRKSPTSSLLSIRFKYKIKPPIVISVASRVQDLWAVRLGRDAIGHVRRCPTNIAPRLPAGRSTGGNHFRLWCHLLQERSFPIADVGRIPRPQNFYWRTEALPQEFVITQSIWDWIRNHLFFVVVREYGNAVQDDLWSAFTRQAKLNHVHLPYDIKSIMETWTHHVGYPVVTITRNYSARTATAAQVGHGRYFDCPCLIRNNFSPLFSPIRLVFCCIVNIMTRKMRISGWFRSASHRQRVAIRNSSGCRHCLAQKTYATWTLTPTSGLSSTWTVQVCNALSYCPIMAAVNRVDTHLSLPSFTSFFYPFVCCVIIVKDFIEWITTSAIGIWSGLNYFMTTCKSPQSAGLNSSTMRSIWPEPTCCLMERRWIWPIISKRN